MREAVEAGSTVRLSPTDSHHLARVVRKASGEVIELIDPVGRLWPATVVEAGPPTFVKVADEARGLPPAPVFLYQGLAEWGRLDMVVEKAAELGVAEVVFFVSERARRVPAPDAWRRRRERLARVVESAARQAGRGHLTRVRGLLPLDAVFDEIPPGEGLLLDARGDRMFSEAVADLAAGARTARIVVGPDTGFSEAELSAARAAGLSVCMVGPATLRSETAALVGMSLTLGVVGGLDGAAP